MASEQYVERWMKRLAESIMNHFGNQRYEILKISERKEIDVMKMWNISGLRFGHSVVRIIYERDIRIIVARKYWGPVCEIVKDYENIEFNSKKINLFRALGMNYKIEKM